MAVQLHEETDKPLVTVTMTGRLIKEDYEQFVPVIDRLVKQHGKIDMLLIMDDFHGWSAGALWQDIKFDLRHFNHIRRLAIVGQKRWQHGMAVFCRPFTTAKVRYFEHSQVQQARDWASEESAVAGGKR